MTPEVRRALAAGVVIPAHPLALDANYQFDEDRQRVLTRYYLAAGAGGLAVGVHTTQFAIHGDDVGLYKPVLALAAEEMSRIDDRPLVRVAGVLGSTQQAAREASIAADLGYNCALLSLAGLGGLSEDELIDHCAEVADVLPVFGFYLQPDVGGIELPFAFWRRFCEIENVVAIKIAAFNRYRTLDVVRATAEVGRDDISLYTGNDDNIVMDLLTPYEFQVAGQTVQRSFVGGLLGHWAVWTRSAVELLRQCHEARRRGAVPDELWVRSGQVTDSNAVIFDAAHRFHGCIPGIHEVLRRQGLLKNTLCLDPKELLSPGQSDELDRIYRDYPDLNDDAFVAEHLDAWL